MVTTVWAILATISCLYLFVLRWQMAVRMAAREANRGLLFECVFQYAREDIDRYIGSGEDALFVRHEAQRITGIALEAFMEVQKSTFAEMANVDLEKINAVVDKVFNGDFEHRSVLFMKPWSVVRSEILRGETSKTLE